MSALRMKLIRLSVATIALASSQLVLHSNRARAGETASAPKCCDDAGCCKNGDLKCASFKVNGEEVICTGPYL
jgi:hypothetical protein